MYRKVTIISRNKSRIRKKSQLKCIEFNWNALNQVC